MIDFQDVHKRFGQDEVLRGVSFAVRKGGVHFVVGKSGAGKSVLIKQVVGLLRPDAGRILLDGNDLVGLSEADFVLIRRRCQLIFQQATLFDGLSVLDNVALPAEKRFRRGHKDACERAKAALTRVHAEHLLERAPGELGAGVKKRVAIARALALEPEVLLYDEPTTSLDPVSARRTDRLIAETAAAGVTSLVVSHDLVSVRAIGDWVTFLHEGRVRFDGSVSDFWASDDPEVRRFVSAVVPAYDA